MIVAEYAVMFEELVRYFPHYQRRDGEIGGLVGACVLSAILARLARISEFRLSAHLFAYRMDSSGALSGISPRSANMHNSSFFQILPRAQLKEWCAQRMAH